PQARAPALQRGRTIFRSRQPPWDGRVRTIAQIDRPIPGPSLLLGGSAPAGLRQAVFSPARYQRRRERTIQSMAESTTTAKPARRSTATRASLWWKVRDWKRI